MRKVFVKTYGCQMNVYDSERMSDSLTQLGYKDTGSIKEADLVILNTCHIREKATEKVYSEVGRIRKIKQQRNNEGKQFVIGVAGCVAQAEGEEILRRAPAVDMVFGPQSYHRLPNLLAKVENGASVVDTDFPTEDKFDHLPLPSKNITKSRGVSVFLTVQEGCDKFCTFCVVPYTRGVETSRPVEKILVEARRLAESGVRELTLLGQNVNAYHGEGPDGATWGLGKLLYEIAEIPGIARLRYTTSHPLDMDDELIDAHRNLDTLMPYLHLPVQSGSNKILKSMNRKHTRDEYFRVIDRIKSARPDIALSGDFIVGFPDETEQDFNDTIDLVENIQYCSAFSFKYSPRPGTPGAEMKKQVPDQIKSERLSRLQALLVNQQQSFNESKVGTKMDVLLEKTGKFDGQLAGRSPWLQAVHLKAPTNLLGTIKPVYIESKGSNSLNGRLIETDQSPVFNNTEVAVAGGIN